jgi:hypothetical protein
MRSEKKVYNELKEALERYKVWCESIDKKETCSRNTPEEIEELDKDFKREVILPLIAELKWIRLCK